MATDTKGFKLVGASVLGSVWGTAVLAGANRGLEIFSESMTADVQGVENMQNQGKGSQRAEDKGNEFYRGALILPAKYESLDLLIGLVMGAAAAPVQQGADLAYKHVFSLADDVLGKFATIALFKDLETHEYDSVKVTGMTFEFDSGAQFTKCTFDCVARKLNVNTGAGTNNNTTAATVTFLANRNRMLFQQMIVRLNDSSGIALASGDKQSLQKFSISVKRPFIQDDVDTSGGFLVSEPVQDGHALVTGQMAFRVYRSVNQARFTDYLTKTKKKADVVLTGGLISGTSFYTLSLFLNDIVFKGGTPQVAGPGVVAVTFDWKAHQVPVAPTGFTAGYLDPVTIELINGKSTNAIS